ncbi:hypothetical protein Tco_1028852 [Tanacetum coccineum]|uniref:Uncharacterized protein n=1 Tax=Tanacetum coccineum TaxID=301880 RepID=A0ABQ5G232_9ASTR
MPTEMELTLEQTQQGVSYEVSKPGQYICCQKHSGGSDIEDSHGPSDAMHNPLPATQNFFQDNIRVNSFTRRWKSLLVNIKQAHGRLCKWWWRSGQVFKLRNFKKDAKLKLFKNGHEHVGPEVASPQDWPKLQVGVGLCWLMDPQDVKITMQIQVQGTSSNQEVNDHNNIFSRESQEYELKTRDKA